MVLSDPKNTSFINEDEEDDDDLNESSMQGGAVVERSEKDEATSTTYKFELSDFDSKLIRFQISFLYYCIFFFRHYVQSSFRKVGLANA